MFQVWKSDGDSLCRGPRFRSLDDALRYVNSGSTGASFAIQQPDGQWSRDPSGSTTFRARRPRSRRSTFARGSGPHDITASSLPVFLSDPGDENEDDETNGDGTDVDWPPGEEDVRSTRKIFG
jgi:hypothetical protein